MERQKILIVDDSTQFQKLVRLILEKHGFEVMVCDDGTKAMEAIENSPVDLIISDYKMPNMDGLQLLKALRKEGREIPYILVTAHGSIDSTMEAIKLRTVEYLTKPLNPKEILLAIQKALNKRHIKKALANLQQEGQRKYHIDNMIGQGPVMQKTYEIIHKASHGTANVLLSGETGTGKELAARAIHYNGLRKNGPFVAVNCSAFSKGILESELFGHVKGAYTGAHRDHKGRFELADQGTLFLDEVGDIPFNIQVKLLRTLQEKQFEPVGGQQTMHSDFRLIAATNKDLKDLIRKGLFREDLFYRLSVININMPPLRDHSVDIPLLIKHFLKHYNRPNQKDIRTLSLGAMKLMQNYLWPGNVRQLENAIERAVALCEGNMIRTVDLPAELSDLPSQNGFDSIKHKQSLPGVVEAIEKEMIQNILDQSEGVKAHTAKELGISERVLSYKMDKYGIKK